MARPTVIKDDALLTAARDVFLERGVSATTAEVAARAGVSEGTLFKRFGTKNHLFECAMGAASDTAGLVERVAYGAKDKPIESIFEELGDALFAKFRQIIPLILMHMAGAASHEQSVPFGTGTPPPLRLLAAVEGLFGALVEDRKLAKVDVPVLARMFVGAIWQYVFLDYAMRRFAGMEAHPMDPSEFVRAHTRILLSGAAPKDASHAPTSKHRASHSTQKAPSPRAKRST
jgi:AcrR family transcriptional regulator